jgi:hypothetical protein
MGMKVLKENGAYFFIRNKIQKKGKKKKNKGSGKKK